MRRTGYPASGLHGRVVHDIGRRIVAGGIAPGETLPSEAELADTFGASRSAIREAMKVLAAKGLVEPRRRAGTRVRPHDAWNLLDPDVLAWHPPAALLPAFRRDLVELRQVIEPAAAAFAALRSRPEDRSAILAAWTEMAAAGGDAGAFYAADLRFHLAIFTASRNALIERLSTIVGALLAASFQAQSHGGRNRPFPLAIEDHRAVYDAIAARDAPRARTAMLQILDQSAIELAAEGGGSGPASALGAALGVH